MLDKVEDPGEWLPGNQEQQLKDVSKIWSGTNIVVATGELFPRDNGLVETNWNLSGEMTFSYSVYHDLENNF